MKYVILIHSNPQPWGHPTGNFVAENQALPQAQRDTMNAAFEQLLTDLSTTGELVGGEALGDPVAAKLFGWATQPFATHGPYAEAKEHLAGFFLIQVTNQARADRGPVRRAG